MTDSAPSGPTPNSSAKVSSYALLADQAKTLYLDFYKDTYRERGAALDRRTKELVAIAASLAFNCQNCLDGHIKKALRDGATRDEISEVIQITLGVAAAAVVDRSDLAGFRLGLSYDSLPEGPAGTASRP
jgi:AhpD family alkylhydroperoxidase